jgi:hypothetical protein
MKIALARAVLGVVAGKSYHPGLAIGASFVSVIVIPEIAKVPFTKLIRIGQGFEGPGGAMLDVNPSGYLAEGA